MATQMSEGGRTVVNGGNLRRQIKASSWASLAVAIGLVAATCMAELAQCDAEKPTVSDELQRQGPELSASRRPIFQSEFSLRNSIQETNSELRQLKRDFVQQLSDLYIGFRLDPNIGYRRAHESKLFVASANILMAEQFAELVIKKHIIQRRLLTGLKRAYIKMLPLPTLINLYKRHPETFAWLRYQQQVDIRPKFEGLTEDEFGDLYRLIGLRAQVRAAEDVLALTSDNVQRILQTLNWYLVDERGAEKATNQVELVTLASHARQVLTFYLDEVIGLRERLHDLYETYMRESGRALIARLQASSEAKSSADNGEELLVRFLDRLINVEALDIGLNREAKSFELPPTITEQMINKLLRRWIPSYVLESVLADRKLLVTNRKRVSHLIKLADDENKDLAKWALDIYTHICRRD